MAIDPRRVLQQVALRVLHISGSTQAQIESAYTTLTLDGADVSQTGMIHAVIATEGQIADLIGGDKGHPYRAALYGRSDNLADKAEIPAESDEGVKFVGVFSGVNDSTTHEPLTEGTVQEIARYRRASADRYTTDIRKYKFWGGRLHHTRTRAYIEGCVWSRAAALARFTQTSPLSPIPTAYEPAWVAQAIAFLVQEGWLVQEASYYQNFAASSFTAMKNRALDIPVLPTQEASANAVSN